MKRRELLKYGTAAALAAGLPGVLPGADPEPGSGGTPIAWDRILVLIELKGGNDGLNTVVPIADQDYYTARGTLAIPQDQALRLAPTLGLHPVFEPLMDAWQKQEMAIVMGTGYERPNRSHFRGIDIWHGGTDADEIAHDGWLARILDDARQGQVPEDLLAHSLVWGNATTVGHAGLGPLFGREMLETLVMNRPDEFLRRAKAFTTPEMAALNPTHAHVLKAHRDLVVCAGRMEAVLQKAKSPAGDWPRHNFGRHMQQTAQFITGGARLPVYKLTIDGFDTHAGQGNRHQGLLDVVAKSVAALRTACIEAGVWDRVLVMTYSEFGRRVATNSSNGTDHGTAAPQFFIGGKVRGGVYGEQPPCSQLQGGDLIATVDYRQLYTTMAQEWWGYQGEFLKNQRRYKPLGLIKA